MPLVFVISRAYAFQPYEFSPRDSCCQARFDFATKVPAGSTEEQFTRMLQDLLVERFKLAFHHQQKEMTVYELTVGEKGSMMKDSAPDKAPPGEDPWETPTFGVGKDGHPELRAGRSGLAGLNGRYRWIGLNLSMNEIVKILSFHLGGPVINDTELGGKYDINITSTIDLAWTMERAGLQDQIPEVSGAHGPSLINAVRDQLGLHLIAKKGRGEIVVVDQVAKSQQVSRVSFCA